MKTWYDKYKKLNKEELYILWLYYKNILEINISCETNKDQWGVYNTFGFQSYKMSYLLTDVWEKIKKGIPKCYFNPNFYKLALILAIIIQFIDYFRNITY